MHQDMIIEPAQRLEQVTEFYFSTKLRELRKRMADGEDIINLGIGNPDMMPSETTLKKLIASAVEPGNHGYQPYTGIPELRQAMSDWYLDIYGVSLDPQQELLPLIGSKEGIMHISMAFLNAGDEVLVPNPGYPTYAAVSRITGAVIRHYDLEEEKGWMPDLEALQASDLSKVKLMWINYPHMPTGTIPSQELFEALIAFGKRNRILICHDNPYSLVLNPTPRSIFSVEGAREVAVELNSLSKSHNMAGWRIGMMAGAPAYVRTVLKVKSNMDSGMFMPVQQAAAEALKNSYAWHRERNAVYEQRRVIAWKILDALGCHYSHEQAGMFIWARIPEEAENSERFSDQILDQTSVFITPGFIFGSQGDQYIRISLCTPQDRLEEALNRLHKRELVSEH